MLATSPVNFFLQPSLWPGRADWRRHTPVGGGGCPAAQTHPPTHFQKPTHPSRGKMKRVVKNFIQKNQMFSNIKKAPSSAGCNADQFWPTTSKTPQYPNGLARLRQSTTHSAHLEINPSSSPPNNCFPLLCILLNNAAACIVAARSSSIT